MEEVVEYKYDTWGNVIGMEGSDYGKWVGSLNPFRYRGYYYDETGMYYLITRYYNPEWCRFLNADAILPDSPMLGSNIFTYCLNDPIAYSDENGMCAKAWAAGFYAACPGEGWPGCLDNNWPDSPKDDSIASVIDKKVPPDHPDFKPPKKGNRKVQNPNGAGKGWLAKDGGVWVPTDKMHGGEGWTVQYPGGGHKHAYPGGHVREATKVSDPVGGSALILMGVVGLVYLVANDATIAGIADDSLIPQMAGCVVMGVDEINGKYVCDECGESWYEYK